MNTKDGSSVSRILEKVIEIADINNDENLRKWAYLELEGYYASNKYMTEEDVVPEYREVAGEHRDAYGRPLIIRDPKHNFVNTVRLRQSVVELESLSKRSEELLSIKDPRTCRIIEEDLQRSVVEFVFNPASLDGILNSIKQEAIRRSEKYPGRKELMSMETHQKTNDAEMKEKIQKAIVMIEEQEKELSEIVKIAANDSDSGREKLKRWKTRTIRLLTEKIHPDEGKKLEKTGPVYIMGQPVQGILREVDLYCAFLNSLKEELAKHPEDVLSAFLIPKGRIPPTPEHDGEALQRLRYIIIRFHTVATELRLRYQNRPTLDITDEYDVQDLVRSLLALFFDDIRPEEWTPSYAGKSSRVDFFLKPERFVVEVKKTRPNLREKEIGDQLIIDIERYRKMPDCRRLICFVYDPDYILRNPTGFQSDLSREEQDFSVEVLVVPKRH